MRQPALGPTVALVFSIGLGAMAAVGVRDGPSWKLSPPAPAVALRPPGPVDARDVACAECHRDVVEEWSRTAHALAWVDELYQAELGQVRRPELCQGCHVPRPLLVDERLGRPIPREDGRDLGITCEACHLGPDGTMLGPRGTATDAHPTRRSDLFAGERAGALCAGCHSVNIGPVIGVAKDFESSRQAERGRSCAGCHLALLERQPEHVTAIEGAAPMRSHALQTPRDPSFLRRAFSPRLVVEGERAKVVIENRAGHRVPGLKGRRILFRAEALGAGGAVVARGELQIDAGRTLAVDGSLEIDLDTAGAGVRLVGLHYDPRANEPVTFLDESLKPE